MNNFCFESKYLHLFWSNYSNLTRPIYPKWWFSKGNPLISGKSRLVKYYSIWPESVGPWWDLNSLGSYLLWGACALEGFGCHDAGDGPPGAADGKTRGRAIGTTETGSTEGSTGQRGPDDGDLGLMGWLLWGQVGFLCVDLRNLWLNLIKFDGLEWFLKP